MSMRPDLLETAQKHASDIIRYALEHSEDSARSIVVYDNQCELTTLLARAYKTALPNAKYIDFDQTAPEAILAEFDTLKAGDLVVLVQSTNFRLNAFRVRVDLFKNEIKVIEHSHIFRMTPEEANIYVDSLAYDPAYYRGVGKALKEKLLHATQFSIVSGLNSENTLSVVHLDSNSTEPLLDTPCLNVGDYSELKNKGGLFPIGEVFTEAKNLQSLSGRVTLFAYADTKFEVRAPEVPIVLVIEKGIVVQVENTTEEFERVLTRIRGDEEVVWVRELGLGLNRAFKRHKIVRDVGTYERMCGLHLSLGAKHSMYIKPEIRRKDSRHHVDVFVEIQELNIDGKNYYVNEEWVV